MTDNLPLNGGLQRIRQTQHHLDDVRRLYPLFRDEEMPSPIGDDTIRAAYAAVRELEKLVGEIKAEQARRRAT